MKVRNGQPSACAGASSHPRMFCDSASLPQQARDLALRVEAGVLVKDHRAGMVGVVVAVDGMGDVLLGHGRDGPQDVVPGSGRGVDATTPTAVVMKIIW